MYLEQKIDRVLELLERLVESNTPSTDRVQVLQQETLVEKTEAMAAQDPEPVAEIDYATFREPIIKLPRAEGIALLASFGAKKLQEVPEHQRRAAYEAAVAVAAGKMSFVKGDA